ncbi:MAG: NAD(P)/FAD-dependent oxidoreductase [Candidatus Thorarchaeota archaeon]
MVDYDVIIVGGGPAGSTAARRASQAGLSVVLFDKARFPRYKPCAGGIRSDVSMLLDFDIKSIGQRKISGATLFAPSGFRVDCIPDDRSVPGSIIKREDFDHLLLKKASEAGAEIRENTRIAGAKEEESHVIATTNEGEEVTGMYLVGADGINSIVAKNLGFYDGWRGDSAMVAIEVEAEVGSSTVREICGEPSGYDADLIFLYFGGLSHGYVWCFPKQTVLSLGACCRQDRGRELRPAYEKWYAKFKDEYGIEPQILSDTAARFPIKRAKNIVRGRTILVGDAAGLVDPFTGEGIPEAIESGILASSALSKAVKEANPRFLREYEKNCKREIISELKAMDFMANTFYKSRKNMETMCRFFRNDSHANFLIAAGIGGLIRKKALRTKMMLRMAKKMPREAISLLL